MELYDELKEAGAVIDNHKSDLYVKKTDVTDKILSNWTKQTGFKYGAFRSEGETWFEVPFMFKPFWDRVSNR